MALCRSANVGQALCLPHLQSVGVREEGDSVTRQTVEDAMMSLSASTLLA